MTDAHKKHYKHSYGAWAGLPLGNPPDYDRCCHEIPPQERWDHYRQCSRKRGYGPDRAYCKQHDPAAIAKREAAARERADEESRRWKIRVSSKTFHDALRQIADGHNDPRALAQEVLAKFDAGAWG